MKIAELKGKPFKCIVVSTNWGKGKNAGRMLSNLCVIAKDDDCEEFVTCIKFPCNGRPQQELIADAGQMSSYPCAVAQDDDRKRSVTCIKVIQAREREAERGGARSDFGPQPWTRWHTSCLMTWALLSGYILRCTHRKAFNPTLWLPARAQHPRLRQYRPLRSRRHHSSLSRPCSGGPTLRFSLSMSRETRATQKLP